MPFGGGDTPTPTTPPRVGTAPAKPKGPQIPATFVPNWQRRAQALQKVGYTSKQIQAAYKYDLQNASQGKKPWTDAQAYAAAHAVKHGVSEFFPQTGGHWGGGLMGIVKEIPAVGGDLSSLPNQAYHFIPNMLDLAHKAAAQGDINSRWDVAAATAGSKTGKANAKKALTVPRPLVQGAKQVQGKLAKGDIGGAIQAVTQQPGVAIIPGAWTAGNVAAGDWSTIRQHPLLTALDVLPAASAAGEALAPRFGGLEPGSASEAFAEGNVPKGIFRASLGTVDEAKSLTGDKLFSEGTVTKLPRSSELVRAYAEDQGWDRTFRETVLRQFETDRRALVTHANETAAPLLETFGKDPETQAAVGAVLEGRAALESLPEHLQPLVTEYNRIDQLATARGVATGDLRQIQDPHTGEMHTYEANHPVIKAYDKYDQAIQKAERYHNDPTVSPELAAKSLNDATKAEAKFNKAFLAKPSRVWYPLMYQHATADLQALFEMQKNNGEISPETYTSYMEEMARGSIPKAAEQAYKAIVKDHAQYWYKEYLGGGKRPVYVPNASESQISAMMNIKPFADHVHTESIYKSASLSQFRPGVANIALQLTYREMQSFLHDTTARLVNTIGDTFARTGPDARSFEAATIGKTRVGLGSSLDTKIDNAFERNWVAWNDSLGKHPGAVSKFVGEEDHYIPRSVANAIEKRLKQYDTPAGLAKFWDKSTKTFRLAVTTSPRHVVHVTTAGMMYQGLDDPSGLLYARAGWQFVKSGEFEKVPELGSGTHMSAGMASDDIHSYFNGITQGEMLKAHLQSIPVVGGAVGGAFGKASSAIDWLHTFEGHIAGMWKSASFLKELDSATREGLPYDEARMQAIQYANKIHLDADTMTPFERTLTRNVAPFYAFTRQLLRYMFRYPGDHPLAASFIARSAEMELGDQNTGLPGMWQSFVKVPSFLRPATDIIAGGQGSYVDVKTLNPFRNLGEGRDPWTMSGLISSLNPAYRAPLEYLGINSLSANVNQYLGQHVDPQTGSLVSNPAMSGWDAILHNYIPQSNIPVISQLLQSNTYLDQLSQSDPAAYRKTLFSILGVPFTPFDPQKNRALIKTQLNYMKVAQTQVSAAVKSGDFSSLDQYTEIPYKGAVLSPEALKKLLGVK